MVPPLVFGCVLTACCNFGPTGLRMSAGGHNQDGRGEKKGNKGNQYSQGSTEKYKYFPPGIIVTLPTLARTIPCFLRANNQPQQPKDQSMQKKTPPTNYSASGASTSVRCINLLAESQWMQRLRAYIRWDPNVTVCFGALSTETSMRTQSRSGA